MPSEYSHTFWPKDKLDRILFTVFILGGPYTFWYEYYYVSAFYYGPNYPSSVYIHVFICVFAMMETYCNLWKLRWIDMRFSHRDTDRQLASEENDWKFCQRCQFMSPPRSHHCKSCNFCVLKRDHHCWFAGTCIGHGNHRYYIILITYVWFAALYLNIYNLDFVMAHITSLQDLIGAILAPHFGYVLGYYTLGEFYIRAMTTIGLVFLFLFSWLLILQILQLPRGQTQYELKKGIRIYSQGLWANIKSVLGNRPCVVWIAPWIHSSIPGDGINFPLKSH